MGQLCHVMFDPNPTHQPILLAPYAGKFNAFLNVYFVVVIVFFFS
jgi:hypothetical protein